MHHLYGKPFATDAVVTQDVTLTLDTSPGASVGQRFAVSGDYVEVWCVPCAARASHRLLHRGQTTALDIRARYCTSVNILALRTS